MNTNNNTDNNNNNNNSNNNNNQMFHPKMEARGTASRANRLGYSFIRLEYLTAILYWIVFVGFVAMVGQEKIA